MLNALPLFLVQKLHFSLRRIRWEGAPGDLQHSQGVVKCKLSLEVQQKPAVAKEEVVCPSRHQVGVKVGVGVLQEQLEMLEFHRHELPIRPEVALQSFHDATEADEGVSLVVHNRQYRGGNVTHALTVRDLKQRTITVTTCS